MTIRPAVPADAAAIIEVGALTWPATYAFAGPEYIADGLARWWSPEATARSLAETTVLVADDGAAISGIGNIDLRAEAAVIWKLYVRRDRQGTGVGSALIRELIARAGDRPVRLSYLDGNDRAAAFYAAHGFTELRREPNDRPGWPDSVWLER